MNECARALVLKRARIKTVLRTTTKDSRNDKFKAAFTLSLVSV